MGVGAAESGGTPANLSLISDYFHKDRRSTAIGIYLVGSQVGTLVGFALTGVVAARYGWRAALLVAGVPGLILMLALLLFVREPARQETEKMTPLAAFDLIRRSPLLLHIIIGSTISNAVAAGVSSWIPSFLIRSHGMNVESVGLTMAATIYPLSTLASVLAGLATDRFAARRRTTVFGVMAGSAFAIVPAIVIAVLTGSLWLAMAGFAAQHVLHMFVNTPAYAMTMDLVPPRMRGTTAALLQVLSNLIGFGVGPMVGGALSDALAPRFGAESLRYALAIFVFASLWPCAHYLRAAVLAERSRHSAEGAAAPAAAQGA